MTGPDSAPSSPDPALLETQVAHLLAVGCAPGNQDVFYTEAACLLRALVEKSASLEAKLAAVEAGPASSAPALARISGSLMSLVTCVANVAHAIRDQTKVLERNTSPQNPSLPPNY